MSEPKSKNITWHGATTTSEERQKLLERHRMPFLKIDFPEFKHHFEHHVSSLRKVLHDDIGTIKRMKEGVMVLVEFPHCFLVITVVESLAFLN